MSRRRIRIVEMGKHFLYLPVYFAEHKNFFGLLPDDVHVEIERCEAGTDEATYAQMMDRSAEFCDDVIAITDPIQILNTPLNSSQKPAILATLVTNGAFWAVNHGEQTINGLRDLGLFERVIAFRPGTTSYSIAARIARESGKPTPLDQFIEVVDPGNELLLLTDTQKGKNAVALSPDVLRIENMIQNHRASIELELGRTAEYNDVLVTALVSYGEFVGHNSDIVQGIVSAVQKALVMTRLQHPDVIRFATDAFRFGDYVAGAVKKAVQAEVIPMSTAVAQAHWMHAAKAHFDSVHSGVSWTTNEEANTLEYYKVCVEPYAKFSEEATRQVLESAPGEASKVPRWSRLLPFAIPILATLASPVLGVLPTLGILLGSWITWWLAKQNAIKPYPVVYWTVIMSLPTGTLVIALPYIAVLDITEKSVFLWVGPFLLAAAVTAAAVGYNLYYAKHDKS